MKALIIGGSMAGLFAALLLRQRGVEAVVFERAATELSGRGAGIATHVQILEVIESLGLDTRELGVSIGRRRVFGSDGRLVAESVRPQLMTSWDRLFTLLRVALPAGSYRRGQEFVRAEQNNSGVTAHFADGGGRASGDLLIGADGLRSSVRTSLISQQPLLYAGYVAWRALAAEHSFPRELHDDLFNALGFTLPAGEQMLGYPVAGPGNDLRPGHRRYNIVWYRPADEPTLARLLTDARGHRHDISIPPPLIPDATVAELRTAGAILAPQFRNVLDLCDRPFLQPIYDFEASRMHAGRVALIGDAAFVVRPHVGAGVAKAAQDAAALAQALATAHTIEAGLEAFEATRRPMGQRMVARGRDLGAAMQARLSTQHERAMAARYRDPAAVLADTATLDFL